MSKTQELIESSGLAISKGDVDVERGTIKNVKILGEKSINGRRYLPHAMERARPLYEGARVYVDHRKPPRNVEDRIGRVENVRFTPGTGKGDAEIRGDLRLNTGHRLTGQILRSAQEMPEQVGCSHIADGRVRSEKGELLVEEIVRVKSVDLVDDAATTTGLFEGKEQPGEEPKESKMELSEMKIEEILKARPDVRDAILKEQANSEAAKQALESIKTLKEENEKYKAEAEKLKRKETVLKLCEEAKLPEAARTDVFISQLMEAKDDAAVKALIEDRVAIAGQIKPGTPPAKKDVKPKSEAQHLSESKDRKDTPKIVEMDSKSFAGALGIRRRTVTK